MEELIIDIINLFGYWGIFILMVLENFLLFIPSEVILACGGFLTTFSKMELWAVILSATIGSLIGAMILYYIGMRINQDRLEKLLSGKVSQAFRLQTVDLDKAHQRLAEKGVRSIFYSRFIPIVRCLISIPAGASRVHIGVFLLLTTAGTSIWNSVLVWFGALAGKSWQKVSDYLQSYSQAIIGLVILVLLFIYIARRIRKKNNECDSKV